MEYQDTLLNQQQPSGAQDSSEFITEVGMQEVNARVIYLFRNNLKQDDGDNFIRIVFWMI